MIFVCVVESPIPIPAYLQTPFLWKRNIPFNALHIADHNSFARFVRATF